MSLSNVLNKMINYALHGVREQETAMKCSSSKAWNTESNLEGKSLKSFSGRSILPNSPESSKKNAPLLLLLLLLSRFSRVRLCATPETAAHQAPPSLGFSRQEHWSGLPFPSPKKKKCTSKPNNTPSTDKNITLYYTVTSFGKYL